MCLVCFRVAWTAKVFVRTRRDGYDIGHALHYFVDARAASGASTPGSLVRVQHSDHRICWRCLVRVSCSIFTS